MLGHIYKSGVEKIDVVFQGGSREKKTLEKKKDATNPRGLSGKNFRV